jgi:hypothetical protein
MAKLFDVDGNEIEALTAEEVEAKTKEAIEAYVAEHPDKSDDLAVASNKLGELEEEIKVLKGDGGEGEKGGQVDRLKKAKEEKDEQISALEKTIQEQGENFAKFKAGMFADIKSKALEKLSNGDEEVAKKIELEFEGFGDAPDSEAGTIERMAKAATIVNGSAPVPNFMDNATKIATAKGDGQQGDLPAGEETENSKSMRKQFEISDKDVEEFGGEVTPKVNIT